MPNVVEYTPLQSEVETPDAMSIRSHVAAVAIAQDIGSDGSILEVRCNPPAWVYRTDDDSAHGRVIRLVADNRPYRLLAQTQNEIEVLQGLRASGARVLEFTEPAQMKQGLVGTVSKFLPNPMKNYGYGEALGTLHNASALRPDLIKRLPSFDPLQRAKRTFAHLANCALRGAPQEVDGVAFPRPLLDYFADQLKRGIKATNEMSEIARIRGHAPAALQEDATPKNALADERNVTTLLDLNDMKSGPAEYDLGRPLGQWLFNFKGREEATADLLHGYTQTFHRPLDHDVLRRAIHVSKLSWAGALLGQAVDAIIRGEQPSAWHWDEGMRRIESLEDPASRWRSFDEYYATLGN